MISECRFLSIKDSRPKHYRCQVGDFIKIHTLSFGNYDYNISLKKHINETFIVTYANDSDYTLAVLGSNGKQYPIEYNKFAQRYPGGRSHLDFCANFEIVGQHYVHTKGDLNVPE